MAIKLKLQRVPARFSYVEYNRKRTGRGAVIPAHTRCVLTDEHGTQAFGKSRAHATQVYGTFVHSVRK